MYFSMNERRWGFPNFSYGIFDFKNASHQSLEKPDFHVGVVVISY
jgi:hypothetical protein